jgi:hypothetical protein
LENARALVQKSLPTGSSKGFAAKVHKCTGISGGPGEKGVNYMTFDELSDQIMGPVLDRMPREEQAKLLLLLSQTVSRSGQAWIDKELKARKPASAYGPAPAPNCAKPKMK